MSDKLRGAHAIQGVPAGTIAAARASLAVKLPPLADFRTTGRRTPISPPVLAGAVRAFELMVTLLTGLVVAIPGLFFQYQVVRSFERYKAFIAHVESVCAQVVYRKSRQVPTAASPSRMPAHAGVTAKQSFATGRP